MSGRKNILPAFKLVEAESLGASFTSDPVTLTTVSRLAVNIKASSVTDNTGTFDIEHRVFKDQNNYSDWVALTLSASLILNDDDTSLLADLSLPPGQFRVKFNAAGGTPDGVCDIWITGAQEG